MHSWAATATPKVHLRLPRRDRSARDLMERWHYATDRPRSMYNLRCTRNRVCMCACVCLCESLSGLIARVFAPQVIYAKCAEDDRDPPIDWHERSWSRKRRVFPRSSPVNFAQSSPVSSCCQIQQSIT